MSLAWRGLARAPARTALVLLGLSVTGALLLDMTMLAGGLEASLGAVLSRLGFAVRVVPRGTLPFSGDSEMIDGDRLAAAIASRPDVTAAVPIVGTNLYVRRGGGRVPSFALGIPIGAQGVYTLLRGQDIAALSSAGADGSEGDEVAPIVVNENMQRLDGVGLGDVLVLSGTPGPLLQAFAGVQRVRVVGIADFYFDLPSQRSLAISTAVLRRLQGRPAGGASVILVRMSDPSRADALARWITARDPRVDAFSLQEFLARTGTKLTYFNQFSLILGTISAAVAFLLITTIVTLSVGERLGEIAMLRALGFSRARIVELILAEGVLLAAAAFPGALLLGMIMAHNLDRILLAAPGVPQNLHFFTLTPRAVLHTTGILFATGALGGLVPAAATARMEIAATLRRETVS
jgi:putative ABC transport system permease protein